MAQRERLWWNGHGIGELRSGESRPAAPEAGPQPSSDRNQPATVAEVVEAMIEQYLGLWYRDFTFVQTVTFYDEDGAEARAET